MAYIDAIIKVHLPNSNEEPELYNLVKSYQIHSHSKSCRKYKNVECRYSFGRYFCDRTIIAEPLSDDLSEEEKGDLLQNRHNILNKVKDFIDKNLNPRKINFLDPLKENYVELKTISEILEDIGVDEAHYYSALSVSSDTDYQIHFKRPPNSCFVNNYFVEGLMAWQANMDIQPVINYYKSVSYMCAYFSKSEDESTEAMRQAAKEASLMNKTTYEQMKSVARAYVTKRECSIQEAVYHVMPELWLRKSFPAVIFANSNIPENRYKVCCSEEEIKELPEDSIDIFKRNMLDRPNAKFSKGKYAIVDALCYAEFLSHYYLKTNDHSENDNQPTVLVDDIIEENHNPNMYPSVLPLMSSKEKLKCRRVKSVLRYHVPNRHKKPEEYAHHMLFMFFPFRDESTLVQILVVI